MYSEELFGNKLCSIGGSSNSDASNTTTTSSNTTNTDNSMTMGDHGTGINGSNNVVDNSAVNNTSMTDTSDRSTNMFDMSNRSTNMTDSSDRSTKFTDNSNRSTNFADNRISTQDSRSTNNSNTSMTDYSNRSTQVTDFGFLGRALDSVTAMSSGAISNNGAVVNKAFDNLNQTTADNMNVLKTAFDFAARSSANSLTSAADVMGFTQQTIDKVGSQVAASKADPNQKLIIAAVVAAGVVAVMAVSKGKLPI
ncbi:hypothetical protein ACO0LL_05655 [Undibacterium sp. TC4M20W]|uniref:hypothetical protein n=1 Tax=Undibacterium sp. TC4M20W TaxID=3413052 RepID=UPI003BEFD268